MLVKKGEKVKKNKGQKIVTRIRADILTIRNHDGTGIIIETKHDWLSAEKALYQIANVTATRARDNDALYHWKVVGGTAEPEDGSYRTIQTSCFSCRL